MYHALLPRADYRDKGRGHDRRLPACPHNVSFKFDHVYLIAGVTSSGLPHLPRGSTSMYKLLCFFFNPLMRFNRILFMR